MKIVLMTVGDLDYENLLPASISRDDGNISHYYHQLKTTYRHFPFVRHLPNTSDAVTVVSGDDIIGDNGGLFSSLPYVMFIIFCLLMPIVVLNTLVGTFFCQFTLVSCSFEKFYSSTSDWTGCW